MRNSINKHKNKEKKPEVNFSSDFFITYNFNKF